MNPGSAKIYSKIAQTNVPKAVQAKASSNYIHTLRIGLYLNIT